MKGWTAAQDIHSFSHITKGTTETQEHQLVNTSCHYELPDIVTADQVVTAILSYAFGKNEWLETLPWQHQTIE